MVRILLEKGADIHARSDMIGSHHNNALHAASLEGREKVVQILLENGADVNAQCGYWGNALQAASFRHHTGVVILLLNTDKVDFDFDDSPEMRTGYSFAIP